MTDELKLEDLVRAGIPYASNAEGRRILQHIKEAEERGARQMAESILASYMQKDPESSFSLRYKLEVADWLIRWKKKYE